MGADFLLSREDLTCSSSAAYLRSDLVVGFCQVHRFGSFSRGKASYSCIYVHLFLICLHNAFICSAADKIRHGCKNIRCWHSCITEKHLTPVSPSVPEVEGIYATGWHPFFEDVPLVEFMYFIFTRMPGDSYCRRLRSLLLYLRYVFRPLINSLVCWLPKFVYKHERINFYVIYLLASRCSRQHVTIRHHFSEVDGIAER